MKKDEVQQLNKALKGEHMAIESLDFLIQDTNDSLKKEKLMKVQRHHKNQATRLAERVQQLGGKPINSAGITGSISDLKHKMKKYSEEDILPVIIDGEKLGLDEFKEIYNEIETEDNKLLINDIMIQNKKIVEELMNFNRY